MAGQLPFRKNRKGGSTAGGDDAPAADAAPGSGGAGEIEPVAGDDAPDTPGDGRGQRVASLAVSGAKFAGTSVRLAGTGVKKMGRGTRVGLVALTERLLETAPRIPVRDLGALREQFPGLDAEQIADKLVAGATKGTATVGAGVGAAAALPVPPAMTVELATETLAVAAVEVKLIAELHEVYGLRAPGTTAQRAYAYVGSWSNRRGVDVLKKGSLSSAVSSQMKRELRQKLLRRTLRNLPTLTPFLVGAAIGGVVNRRDTHRLADDIRADLRKRAVPWEMLEQRSQGPADSPRPALRPPED